MQQTYSTAGRNLLILSVLSTLVFTFFIAMDRYNIETPFVASIRLVIISFVIGLIGLPISILIEYRAKRADRKKLLLAGLVALLNLVIIFCMVFVFYK